MKRVRDFIGYLLSLVMIVGLMLPLASMDVNAATPREVTARVTKFTIQNIAGADKNSVYKGDTFFLAMEWDASANGANMRAGDYFDIKLPDQVFYPNGAAALDFDIYDLNGNTVVGRAHITPGASNRGGKVRITFNNWVNGREDVKGKISITAKLELSQITIDANNTLVVTVGSQVYPVTIRVDGPGILPPEVLGKWGSAAASANEANWVVRINHKKDTLTNLVISDKLTDGRGDETYIPGSFVLTETTIDARGYEHGTPTVVNLTGKLNLAADGRSFSIRMGNVAQKQYILTYRSTYHPGTLLKNLAQLVSSEQSTQIVSNYRVMDSSGDASGIYSKTTVKVEKKWVGKAKDSVTVKLYADGADTGKSVVLNVANQWKGEFANVRKYNDDGDRIEYTVKEADVSGYTAKVTGTQEDGFTVTNTEIPPSTPGPKTPKSRLTPKTGDSNNIGMYGLILLSAITVTGGLLMRRKSL